MEALGYRTLAEAERCTRKQIVGAAADKPFSNSKDA
jgi:hypothetical protein